MLLASDLAPADARKFAEVAGYARDLDREVYCVLGLPIDRVTVENVVDIAKIAAKTRSTLLLSTPNLNFVVSSQSDRVLRESVLVSDLCPPDGMPLIWVARLLGLPIRERVCGSDIFLALKRQSGPALSVCFFGGAPGVGSMACQNLNKRTQGVACVGAIEPGSGSVEEMSSESLLDKVNRTGADIVVAALGAQKGQAWLLKNHHRIKVPVRAHLGAVINFEAGQIKRAPGALRHSGLEWLWRIKEEPHLWKRYWRDGLAFLQLLGFSVLPLALKGRFERWRALSRPDPLRIDITERPGAIELWLSGDAISAHVGAASECLKETLRREFLTLSLELTHVRAIDQRFLGLLLMLRKVLAESGRTLVLTGISRKRRRTFTLNQLEYLLEPLLEYDDRQASESCGLEHA